MQEGRKTENKRERGAGRRDWQVRMMERMGKGNGTGDIRE